MNKLAGAFMKTCVVYALIGFALGVYMGASHDFKMMPVHAHLNLIGWSSMAVFAIYYQLVPVASGMRTAKAHFWVANIGLLVLTISLGLLVSGFSGAEAGTAIGSIVTLISILLFVFIVFRSA